MELAQKVQKSAIIKLYLMKTENNKRINNVETVNTVL